MKKAFILTILSILVISIKTFAAHVDVQAAQTVAINFFKLNNHQQTNGISAILKYTRIESDNTIDFYVFDMSPVKGFVI
ncbi:MAG TPA: Spi family protease inhibitor, partial [Chitinophagales bacterium]|nr:Spi family protease inhibitor [Chitinophagales bacterium]